MRSRSDLDNFVCRDDTAFNAWCCLRDFASKTGKGWTCTRQQSCQDCCGLSEAPHHGPCQEATWKSSCSSCPAMYQRGLRGDSKLRPARLPPHQLAACSSVSEFASRLIVIPALKAAYQAARGQQDHVWGHIRSSDGSFQSHTHEPILLWATA